MSLVDTIAKTVSLNSDRKRTVCKGKKQKQEQFQEQHHKQHQEQQHLSQQHSDYRNQKTSPSSVSKQQRLHRHRVASKAHHSNCNYSSSSTSNSSKIQINTKATQKQRPKATTSISVTSASSSSPLSTPRTASPPISTLPTSKSPTTKPPTSKPPTLKPATSNSSTSKPPTPTNGKAKSTPTTKSSRSRPIPHPTPHPHPPPPNSSCHLLVEQILHTVGELEHTLIEDHQNDFELRMALERQTEKVCNLRSSLETEKQRNNRLVQLIRGVDSSSSTEDEAVAADNIRHGVGAGTAVVGGGLAGGAGGGVGGINGSRWQSRTSMDAFESISPLLMQQRYDELSTSHRQCRRQLVKKEKLLTLVRCEKEELQGRYDHLLDEYRNVQKRFEELCCKYLRLQAKKNQEIKKLREALSYASDCVLSAQQVMELHGAADDSDSSCSNEFRQNLQLFIKALRLCEWVQNTCTAVSAKRQ